MPRAPPNRVVHAPDCRSAFYSLGGNAETTASAPVPSGRARKRSRPLALEDGLLSAAPRAPIRWPDDLPDRDTSDEQKRRAALIAGHLLRDRLRDGAQLSEPVLLAAIAYAGALATPQGQHALADLDDASLLKAHIYACLLGERHGYRIDETEEKALFGWLLAQVEIGPTDDLLRRMLSQRRKRQERRAPTELR